MNLMKKIVTVLAVLLLSVLPVVAIQKKQAREHRKRLLLKKQTMVRHFSQKI